MTPGIVSKLSESVMAASATISPKTDVVRITTNAAIVNIIPPYGGFGGIMFLNPISVFTWTNAGNIAIAGAAQQGRIVVMIYSKSTGKWYPSYTS